VKSDLQEYLRRLSYAKFRKYRPYGHPDTLCPNGKLFVKNGWEPWSNKPWQLEFHNSKGKAKGNICANGVGKSFATLWETVAHLTGEYPDWYDGFRFDKPVLWWVGSIDAALQVEGVQKILLGPDLAENYGTGLIPLPLLVGKPQIRQSGIPGTVHQVRVKRTGGGYSHLVLKTYQQGWKAWQTAAPDGITLDEQPDDNDAGQKPIFEECQTRLFRSSGLLLTPLLGETELTRYFMQPKDPSIFCSTATWDDAAHLKEADKQRLRRTYPAHAVGARTLGVPMMGEGRVIECDEDQIKIPRFEIPPHFARICGLDFGVGEGHPTASAWLALDRDRDTVYLYDEYRQEKRDGIYHAEAIKRRGSWIPIAWPHDGHKTSDLTKTSADGQQVKDRYIQYGLNMLPISARYDRKTGGRQPQEPIIEELNERMKTGRFYVFSDLRYFFEEMRSFHRKDGKIVNRREDTIKAVLYALMMRKYAITRTVTTPYRSTFRGLNLHV
jgi:phage terminase large subunit-like protein